MLPTTSTSEIKRSTIKHANFLKQPYISKHDYDNGTSLTWQNPSKRCIWSSIPVRRRYEAYFSISPGSWTLRDVIYRTCQPRGVVDSLLNASAKCRWRYCYKSRESRETRVTEVTWGGGRIERGAGDGVGGESRPGTKLSRVSLMLNKCTVSKTRAAQWTSTWLDAWNYFGAGVLSLILIKQWPLLDCARTAATLTENFVHKSKSPRSVAYFYVVFIAGPPSSKWKVLEHFFTGLRIY